MFGSEKKKIAELEQYYNEKLAEKDKEIRILKMQLLQKEIRPHFIFNVLASIKQLCIEEPRMAANTIQNFAAYLRVRMDSIGNARCVPFEEELMCIKNYVELERIDPATDFTVEYDIGFVDFDVPLLAVQPMVENAIRHGIETQGGDGVVLIKTFVENGNAVIEISDNGKGEVSETEKQLKHRSVGIANTKERIRLMCNGELDIAYTGNGTLVRYVIPV